MLHSGTAVCMNSAIWYVVMIKKYELKLLNLSFSLYALILASYHLPTVLSSCLHSPGLLTPAGYETWLIPLRNLPYITRAGAHWRSESHEHFVGIMKMDGLQRALTVRVTFLRLLLTHTSPHHCGMLYWTLTLLSLILIYSVYTNFSSSICRKRHKHTSVMPSY